MMRKLLYSFLFFISSKSFLKRLNSPSLGLLCVGMFFVVSFAYAATITSTATGGNWNNSSTWIGNAQPGTGDIVVIATTNGNSVNTNGNRTCAGLIINANAILDMANGNVLTVNGSVTGSGNWTTGGGTRTISLTGDWSFNGTSSGSGATVIFTGNLNQNLSGHISSSSIGSLINNKTGGSVLLNNSISVANFTNTAGVFDANTFLLTVSNSPTLTAGELRLGAALWSNNYSFTPGTLSSGFTIDYYNNSPVINGSITYQNLEFSGSGTTANPSANIIVQGNLLNIGSGILNFAARNVTISGGNTQNITGFTTTGTVSMNKTGGTVATFTGNVNGGNLTIAGATNATTLNLGSGLTHSFSGNWTRTSGTLNGGSSILKIGGDVSGTGGTFTSNTSTVEYNKAGDQNLGSSALTYYNLTTSGSGAKIFGAATTVSNNLTIGSGTTLDVSTNNYALNIGGSFTNNGTFTPRLGTVTLNGSGTQSFNVSNFYNLTLAGTGAKSFTASTTIVNALVINSSANLGTQNHSAASLTYGGTSATPSSWGSTASAAKRTNNTYFGSTATGILNVTCAFFSSVNPITDVILNTLHKTSPNLTTGLTYEDFTAETPTTLVKGEKYALTVKGNTTGYTNGYYTAYFDWNNNGVFTDATESFTIGTIYNSTGADGRAASVYLTIPTAAVAGNIKMRIVGRMGDYSGGPCVASDSAGQIEEYTVTILNSCSGNPTSSTTVSSVPSVCPNEPFVLSLGSSFVDGSTYVWEKSTDGTNWSNTTPTPINFFSSNFSTAQSPNSSSSDGIIVLSGADCLINGTELVLTGTTEGGHNSGFFINKSPNANINAFTAAFKFRIWDTTTGGKGADGMSFSYGNNVNAGAGGGENGEGDGIIIQLDTYDNEGLNGGSRVRVLYNNVMYFTSAINVVPLRNASYQNLVLRVDANAKLSLVIAGTTVVSELFLPGYGAADKSAWKFKFSARTGGENDRHSIDDLSIDFLDTTGSKSTFSTSQTVKTYYHAKISCGGNTIVTSSPVVVDVTSATIDPMASNACTGVEFSVTPTNGTIPNNTKYTWTAPSLSTGLSGGAANTVATDIITGTLVNSLATAQTATYTVTPITGSCTGVPFILTITVNPNPTANAGSALSAICQGATSAAMGGSVGGGATGGTWGGGSGIWTNPNDPANATYRAGASESGSITLTLTTSGGSCGTATASKTITVNPNPTANAGSALSAICQGATSAAMGGSVGGGATGGTWGGGSGIWTNPSDPANATYTAGALEFGSITLTLTTSGGSCNTVSVSKTITVIKAPTPSIVKNTDVSCGSFGSITIDALPADWIINQTGSTTLPETYSGTISTLPIQNLTADTYSFTVTDNATGCTSSLATITIDDISSFTEWNGSAWTNDEPDGSKSVIISSVLPNQPFSNVIPLSKTNIDACSLEIRVPDGSEVIIPSGLTLTITNEVTSNGRLVFRNGSSLIQKTDIQNSGNIVYERETSVRRFDLTYWSSPVTVSPDLGPKMNELSPTTLFDKYFYFEPIAGWKTNLYGGMSMKVGNGYSIRGPQGFDTAVPGIFTGKFVGVPNNGNITVKSVVADKYFFFGNPYPSAVDADALIETNKDVLGTIYLWTHVTSPQKAPGDNTYRYTSDDYIAYNTSGTTSVGNNGAPAKPFDGFIAAGQGFLARPKTTEILFNNAMRVEANNGQFLKTAKSSIEKNRIWLNITNTQGAFKQILVGYIQGATNSVDINYDAFSAAGNSFIDFYSINETKKLTIQGRALPFDNSDLVPLGYKTSIEGEFTIAIDHGDGFFNEQEVYLEDKSTGKITNLRNENYTFSTLTGTFPDRFVLRYTNKTLGTGDFENLESSVLVSIKNKVISITSSKETIKEVNIFDVGAQSLYSKKKVNSSELQITNLHSSDQVLLVKVTLENGSIIITKKVVFSNL
ncbi:GEVED domain-containing protein [Flavobacterium sp. UW10123]|uniref:GEVED domain-containing protein n=1 Tax=Flavobacterium sp. UW10123 TaxID=3230800 RepID=UPI00339378E4